MRTQGLTKLEIKVLEASRMTDFGDCLDYAQWSFAVRDKSGFPEQVYGGVVSSLIKKGLVMIYDERTGNTKFDPNRPTAVFEITDAGRKLWEEE